MRGYLFAVTMPLLASGAAFSGDRTMVNLDVSRVTLFSSGVGYFECEAEVTGNAAAELQFRTEQINDILKSMVVEDFGGGRIGVIGYASRDPIEKTLRSFGVDLTRKPTLGQLLDQLRGERVEVSGPVACAGTIVGVEKARILDPNEKTLQEVERLTLLTDSGLQQLELTRIQGIRLVNPKVNDELRQALSVLATAHDADKKSVTLNFEGQAQRKVRVAYLLETPVWKTSYRLVLAEEKAPFLQGWAIVENATERDWRNIRLTLVSGRPISFRMDLYTPLYVSRPLEELELYASLRPPTYEGGFATAPEAPREEAAMDTQRLRAKAMVPPAALAAGVPAQPMEEQRMELVGRGVEAMAQAVEVGELFAYPIGVPVSIARQHSAMLPIVNQEVAATKVSIFNAETHPRHPLNGIELKNTTKLHLMQGPVTVFDEGIYAGDAKLPDLKPDEKRLLAYALDLSTEVLTRQQSQVDEIVSLRIAKGTLWHRHKYVNACEYDIKNKDDRARTVILEHPFTEDWTLREPAEPYERTEDLLRFKVTVEGNKTKTQKVVLEKVADQSVALLDTGLDGIRFYLSARVISPRVKEALEKVIALRTEVDQAIRRRTELEQEREAAIRDQARIRENLKILVKESDSYQRQQKLFDDFETQIGQLATEIKTAREQEQQKRKALETYLLSLEIE